MNRQMHSFFPGESIRRILLFGMACLLFTGGGGQNLWAAAESFCSVQPDDQSEKNEQEMAQKRAARSLPFIQKVKREDPVLRKIRLHEQGLGSEDIEHDYFLLSSPLVHADGDMYEPVRFMHSKHAASLNDNCAACHHYRPADPEKPETVACRACHKESVNAEAPERLGLKAAYHQRCMGCHQEMDKGPTGCQGCHRKNPTDHQQLVQLPDDPEAKEVTNACLRCHEDKARDFMDTAHWLWKGAAEYTVNRQKEIIGKGTIALNNF